LSFKLSAKSFYQTNPVMTEKLYKTAMDFAKLTPNDIVFDAYSGIGTIGLIAAKNPWQESHLGRNCSPKRWRMPKLTPKKMASPTSKPMRTMPLLISTRWLKQLAKY
jgi:hypothetical protein